MGGMGRGTEDKHYTQGSKLKLASVWSVKQPTASKRPWKTGPSGQLPTQGSPDTLDLSFRPATAGVAVLRRVSGVPLKPLKSLSGVDSPRPPQRLDGTTPEEAREPPYVSPTTQADVANGFDKLSDALRVAVANFDTPESLDSKWIRVGKWVDRYSTDQQPEVLREKLATIYNTGLEQTSALLVPNTPMLAVACTVIYQVVLLVNALYPSYGNLALPAFQTLLQGVYLRDVLGTPHPLLVQAADPDSVVRQLIIAFSSKTYFQTLREASKRFAQTQVSFETGTKEREKLCLALDKIIEVWQLLYAKCLFKAWRGVRRARLDSEALQETVRDLCTRNRAFERSQRRVDEMVIEIKAEKNKEITVLREDLKRAEAHVSNLTDENMELRKLLNKSNIKCTQLEAKLQDLQDAKHKQKKDLETRYSHLARQSIVILEALRLNPFEATRLAEGAWRKFYTPFRQGSKTFRKLNATDDPEELLNWVNELAAAHPLHSSIVTPLAAFEGSPNASHVWACACGAMSPGDVTEEEVKAVLNSVLVSKKGELVTKMIAKLGLPPVLHPHEVVEANSLKHVMLAVVLHSRFLRAAFKTSPAFKGVKAQAEEPLQRSWDMCAEPQASDVVREYLLMTPADLTKRFKTVHTAVTGAHEFSFTSTLDMLCGYAASHRALEGCMTLTRSEARDLPAYQLEYESVQDLIAPEELQALRAAVKKHYRHLRKIYRYYGINDTKSSNASVSYSELWRMVKDCCLEHKTIFDRTHFKVIFSQCDSEAAGKNTLSPKEFIVALVHIANLRFKHRVPTVTEQLTLLLEKWVIPEANYCDVTVFRQQLNDSLVRTMLERRQSDMVKVFKHYASMEMTDHSATLSQREFLKFMLDIKVTDEVCTHHALQQVFMHFAASDDPPCAASDMLFHQFVEAVCAVASFKNPAPYLPVHLRIQRFWQNWVLPPLKKSLKLTDGFSDARQGKEDE